MNSKNPSKRRPKVVIVIPALNEEEAIGRVLDDIPRHLVSEVIVVDNGSTDRTPEIAKRKGAKVVFEPKRGYGAACYAGFKAAPTDTDIVVFMDGDYSDHPEELPLILGPILRGEADLVIGSRMRGRRERGALPPHSLFGNWLASSLLRLIYGQKVTDLGPFRAIRYECLKMLGMKDRGFGWTVEMQARAARKGLRVVEVPVSYRRRIGKSKITGNLLNSIRAGYKILSTIFKVALGW
ncbi:MAG TPA: glycosyltransferase family 2 protein [Armatimonadetes bacterium]|nr:glycosyltransferase family 2 protein [Armatimonadota bacterium]